MAGETMFAPTMSPLLPIAKALSRVGRGLNICLVIAYTTAKNLIRNRMEMM